MARSAAWRRWTEPPQVPVEIDWSHPIARDLVWYSAPSSHPLGTGPGYYLNGARQIINVADPRHVALAADGNNIVVRGPTPAGLGIKGAWSTSQGAMAYNSTSALLSGMNQFSMSVWFYKRAVTVNQWAGFKNFRLDLQHCLDCYSSSPTQLVWGSDWFQNWNGSSPATLQLAEGFAVIGSCIRQNGARYFHQGRFASTKSGGAFSTTSSSFAVIREANPHEILGNAAWRRALEDAEMIEFQRNPYALLKPYRRRLYLIPGSSGATLSIADTSHAHAADALTLTQVHALDVAEALHGHSAEALTLAVGAVLTAADATHGHLVDSPTLTQAHAIAIAEALHAHTAGAVVLTQAHLLAIADAAHVHQADGITLGATGMLAIADALHPHLADALVLGQAHILAISDAAHAHLVDVLSLALPGAVWVGDRVLYIQAERRVLAIVAESRWLAIAAERRLLTIH